MPEAGEASRGAAARRPQAPPAPAQSGEPGHINDFDHALQAAIVEAFGGFSPISLGRAWIDWGLHLAASPGRRMELAGLALTEAATAGAPHEARPFDRRFRDEAWRRWPYSMWASNFLALERWWDDATRDLHGADPHNLALVNFLGRQALDAAAPTNFLFTNPVALARTRHELGANLARGAANFWRDFAAARRGERPQAALAWRPGETVAVTKGAVVKRTPLAEVIQYAPATDKVRPEPVVIVPAWIMKYYILDLEPRDSLIKALTEAGFTVFAISWLNPTGADRDVGFEDYYTEGVRPALEAALAITGARRAHLMGYCIGGALAAVAASASARDGDDRLQSLTLLAAQVDYTEAGELKLFIDHSQIAAIEDLMWEKGVFEGPRMAGAFNLLRSNDLIWSRLVHHYLMGEPETMNAMAAWSTDATRMPLSHAPRLSQAILPRQRLRRGEADGRRTAGLAARHKAAYIRARDRDRPCRALALGVQDPSVRRRGSHLRLDQRRPQPGRHLRARTPRPAFPGRHHETRRAAPEPGGVAEGDAAARGLVVGRVVRLAEGAFRRRDRPAAARTARGGTAGARRGAWDVMCANERGRPPPP